MFELKQLRYFVAVAEELNFRRAAARLHITQPPLSQNIKALEESLGVTLFLRDTHNVRLTQAGEVFLKEALHLLEAVQNSRSLARQAEAGEVGALSIGYSASAIFSTALSGALASLLDKRPRLEVRLQGGNALDHLIALRAGHLDAALLRADLAQESAKGLHLCFLGDEPLYVLLNPRHPLAASQRLFLHDLAEERLLLQPASQRTFLRRQVESLSERAGLSFPYSLEVPDITSMLCFIAAGLGVAVLPANVAKVSRDLVAIPLMDTGSSSPLTFVSASRNTLVKELERLMKECFSAT